MGLIISAMLVNAASALPWKKAATEVVAEAAAPTMTLTTAACGAVALVAAAVLFLPSRAAPKWLAGATPGASAHVLVTGGSEGLGKELAALMASRGARVSIVARTAKKLDAAVAELAERKLSVRAVAGDVTSAESLKRAVTDAEAAHGPVTCVVCCAGGARTGLFSDVSADDFGKQMDLNYLGVVKTLKATLPGMVDRKAGTAVLVSSGLALCGYAGYSAYAPTKWAVRGLAETLRSELLPFDVAVHSVYPPNMDTPGFVEENRTKPKSTKAIEEGEPTHDPKAVAASIVASLDAGHFNVACGDFGIGLLARAANGLSVRTTLLLDVVALPVIAVIGCVYRRMWDRIVRATPN